MNVLAVGAHPLDPLLLAGGTLARYAAEGHSVSLAVMCSPTPDSLAPGETGLTREAETRRAAGLIGAEAHFLRLEVGRVRPEESTLAALAEVVRRTRPRVILTHDPNDYCPDHQHTGEMMQECQFRAREQDSRAGARPPIDPPYIIYMDTIAGVAFEPEQFVDITNVFETKRRMIECYESELSAWADDPVYAWLEWLEVHSRYRGIQACVGYAEAFRRPRKWGHITPSRLLP